MLQNQLLLEVKNLETQFFLQEGTVRAVDGVSFELYRGKTLGIVGESGCGKSVTARSILNIVRPPGRITSGEIIYHKPDTGEQIDIAQLAPDSEAMRRIRWGEIAMIFQEPMASLSPVHTIGNQIVEALRLHEGLNPKDAEVQAIEFLRRVGLPQPDQVMTRYRHQLSGGMRQRAMIAMALCCRPSLLIADEPTTALDVTTQAQILELMQDLQDEFQMAIMFITHDMGVIAEMADDVVVMYLGKEVEHADVDRIFHYPGHPYTQALLRSIPRVDQEVDRLEMLKGNVPDPYSIPKGCAFHNRCAHYVPEKCVNPLFIPVEDRHFVRCSRYFELQTDSTATADPAT